MAKKSAVNRNNMVRKLVAFARAFSEERASGFVVYIVIAAQS